MAAVNDPDWRPVVLTKKGGKSKADIAAADRAGSAVVVKKDEAEEAHHIARVDISMSRKIQQARNAKGLTQKQLATSINEKANVINDYEAGRAIPSPIIITKLERALGVKLRDGAKKKKAATAAADD